MKFTTWLFLSLFLFVGIVYTQDTAALGDASCGLPWKTLILPSVGTLVVMGILAGVGLGVASKVFEVKSDPKVTEINEVLPKINCGRCGYTGCFSYAQAIVSGNAKPNLCLPGGNASAQKIGEIMNMKVAEVVAPVATIVCTRKHDVKKNYQYQGIQDCKAAMTLGSNIYECAFACFGFGTCAKACPFDAIVMDEHHMPYVIEDRCTGCGVCVENCPLGIIKLTPRDHDVHILCASTELPKIKVKVHKKGGCIACRKCVKQCPVQAISVVNNVAVIDYTKCTNCGQCIPVCPTTAIFNIRPEKKKTSQPT